MDAARIKTCADRIARNEAALKWLEEYGVQLSGRPSDQFALTFHANLASACVGAKEAKEVLDAMARFQIEEIVQSAIRNCQNTIVMDRDAIQEEVSK